MYIGINARKSDVKKFNEATRLLNNGASQKEVLLKTGLFGGLDGKPRDRISDESASVSPSIFVLANGGFEGGLLDAIWYKKNPQNLYTITVNRKVPNSSGSHRVHYSNVPEDLIVERFPLGVADAIINDKGEDSNRGRVLKNNDMMLSILPYTSTKLGQVFDHNDLYSNYPELSQLEVKSYSGTSDAALVTNEYGEQYIGISPCSDPVNLKKMLIHEIQHAVQEVEGWNKGATSKDYKPMDTTLYAVSKAQCKINECLSNNAPLAKAYESFVELEVELTQKYPSAGEEWTYNMDMISKSEENELCELMDTIESLDSNFMNLVDKLESNLDRTETKTPLQQYFNSAGEIEARAAVADLENVTGGTINPYSTDDYEQSDVYFSKIGGIEARQDYRGRTVSHSGNINGESQAFASLVLSDKYVGVDVLRAASTVFLRIYGDLAKQLPSDNQIVKDLALICEWNGEPSGSTKISMNLVKNFADAFERYVTQDTSPSKNLTSVFATCKRWVTQTVAKLRPPALESESKYKELSSVFSRLLDTSSPASPIRDQMYNEMMRCSGPMPHKLAKAASVVIDTAYESISAISGIPVNEIQKTYKVDFRQKECTNKAGASFGMRIKP